MNELTEGQLSHVQVMAEIRARDTLAQIDHYVLLYVKKKPRYFPKGIYYFVLRRFLNLAYFEKP